ncbi:MAG: TraR/DksA family transcriptional regulator [Allorhizobium sp.]
MTDTAKYEKILLARKHEIMVRLHKIDDDLGTQKPIDNEDRATESENDEVLEEMGEIGENELVAIDAALVRISAGTYGICVTCGETISPERLDIVPHTPFCADDAV